MEREDIPAHDHSARFVSDDGDYRTFYTIAKLDQKGDADVEEAEDVEFGWVVDGVLYRPVNPELLREARETDTPIGRVRARHAEDESDQPAPSA